MALRFINEPRGERMFWLNLWKNNQRLRSSLITKAHSRIKYVIYLFSNVRSQTQELAVDAMQSGF